MNILRMTFALILSHSICAMEEWELDMAISDDDSLFESPIPEQKDLTLEEHTILKKLRYAIREGHKAYITQFLADGGDPDIHTDKFDAYTLLMYACTKDQPEIAALLIAAGADVNARTPWEATPIVCADPGLKLYQKLVAAGADVNAQCSEGYSALIMAAQDGDLDSCEFLIMHGASLHAKPFMGGDTPLLTAASINNEEKCKLMVERQKVYNRGIILALLYFQKHESIYLRVLYTQRNTLLKPHLEKYTLQALLTAKTSQGKCAYDLMQLEWLRPKGY